MYEVIYRSMSGQSVPLGLTYRDVDNAYAMACSLQALSIDAWVVLSS
jgi:hypothetical protein